MIEKSPKAVRQGVIFADCLAIAEDMMTDGLRRRRRRRDIEGAGSIGLLATWKEYLQDLCHSFC